VHDALKRRCLYHWVEHPDLDREIAIVRSRVPGAPETLTRQVAALTTALRALGLHKPPGVAETIDWVRALEVLGLDEIDDRAVSATLGAVLKYREDAERVRATGVPALVVDALAR
jgi:MoxR-like ATPase